MGDGTPDFFVAAQQQEIRFGVSTGEGYLVFGNPRLDGSASARDVGTPALPGLQVVGDGAWSWFGSWVFGGGDLNADGRQDFLVTAYYQSINYYPPDLLREPSYVYAFYGGARAGLDPQLTTTVTPTLGRAPIPRPLELPGNVKVNMPRSKLTQAHHTRGTGNRILSISSSFQWIMTFPLEVQGGIHRP